MDLEELIRSRRTIQAFNREKVSDELVEKALALSLWVPNHKLTFPWVYLWAGPEARGRIADLSVELKAAKGELSETKKIAIRDAALNPSHLIFLGQKFTEDTQRRTEDYATLSCSVQAMSLYLWSNGVGMKWTTSGFTLHEKTYGILGISPQEIVLRGALMIGKAQAVPRAAPRPETASVLRKTK